MSRSGANWKPMALPGGIDPAAPPVAPRRQRRALWGLCSALVLSVGIGAVNIGLTGRSVGVLGLLATVPFVATMVSGVIGTLGAGLIAVGVALLVGDYDHGLWHRDLIAIAAGIAAATVFATGVAAATVRRLRQLRHTQAVAEVVQQTLLRPLPEWVGGIHVCARYSSATHGAQVGGDVYEALATPYGIRVFVGDVRGKGLPAVQLASTVLGAFREWAFHVRDL